jgi:hypothetical protein
MVRMMCRLAMGAVKPLLRLGYSEMDTVSKSILACKRSFVDLPQSALSVHRVGCSGLGGGCAHRLGPQAGAVATVVRPLTAASHVPMRKGRRLRQLTARAEHRPERRR